jgi:hypothetical protein
MFGLLESMDSTVRPPPPPPIIPALRSRGAGDSN